MNLIELVDSRNLKVEELEKIKSTIELEKRKMNDDENSNFITIRNEIEELNKKIDEIKEADNKAIVNEINQKNKRKNMNTNFSLLKTIRDIVERKQFNEETIAMIDAGKRAFSEAGLSYGGDLVIPYEFRTDPVLAGTQYQGQEVVGETKMPLLESLKAKTVLGAAGATFYTGLKNDVSIPTYDGTTTYWAGEVDAATGGTGAFAEVTLSPKRLTAQISISKQFLAQDSINAEQALIQDLINSILVKVEYSALSADAAIAGKKPAGLFYNADYSGTLSGATSYAKLVGMKGAVDTSNALTGNLAYITTPTLSSIFETTSTDTGSGIFCMNNGKIAGYPVYVTSNVNAGKVAFGNWADYIVANWGNAMDITVDPYSKAGEGKIVITANTYWDFKVRRSASFKLNQLS